MEFGVGLLGARWTPEFAREQVQKNTSPPRPNFHLHASCYAAKVAAETVLAETPTAPDLSDDALLHRLGICAPAPRPSEVHMVRETFLKEYAHVLTPPERRANDASNRPAKESA